MIPKTKLLEWIEDYCLDSLSQSEKNEFENELNRDSELSNEVKFEREIQSAITEKDVLNLREKLTTVAKQSGNESTPFDLLEDFNNIQQLSETLSPEELLKFYDSLPKAHIYQHELVSNENIHEFFREQNLHASDEDLLSDEFDEMEFETFGLEEAILEKDIMNLRETLSKVSASVRIQCSTEEIDAYLNNELSGHELERFEQELAVNGILQREVKLHREMEEAILEPDIMNLRSELSRLTGSQTSWNVSEYQIEEYINGELEGEELALFMAELNENSDLKAEVALRQNVDFSIGEKEIFSLRDKLEQVKHDLESREIRSIVPDRHVEHASWWRAGVAVAVVLIAFAGLMGKNMINSSSAFDDYNQAPLWAPERTVASELGFLQQANNYFVSGEYDKALVLYDQAINEKEEKFVFQFYKASTLQNLEKYEEAIPEYSQVIDHGDNIFVEEAEWYKALCYIKLDNKDEANKQLLAIINRNGFYANDAKKVLRKTRYSLR
jgi:tetratricopeptide (TPR) repeat protein